MPYEEDTDYLFLDRVITLALGIIGRENQTKDHSDDPYILQNALYNEADALLIQKMAKEYRPRLRVLKLIENGKRAA